MPPRPLPLYRVALRMLLAAASCAVVTVGLLALFASLALAIDWDIPEGEVLLGPSSVFDRNGVPLARFAAEVERLPVPLDAIAPSLQHAVIATEDHRFYEHQGVDPFSVLRAIYRNVRTGGIAEGGSTLTQQYVKNVYVGADLTLSRKVREAVVALQFEKERSKAEILEAYLNRVYFGEGAYGAEAAARIYFDKPASALTLAESATLAGVLSAPTKFSPRVDPAGAVLRRNVVLDEMERYGLADAAAVALAKLAPVQVAPVEQGARAVPYFVEEVRRQLLDAYGPEVVYNGGLVVNTTIDVNLQARLEEAVRGLLPSDPAYDAGVVALDPRTGDVLATWSGRSFGASQVDLALRQDYGRPSGSTFKVFALTAALEEGMTLETAYPAPGRIRIGDWRPRGGGGCGSPCPLLEATVKSANTVFAQVGRDVGVEDFTAMARRLGVRSTLKANDLAQVLGTESVTPLDMASAFGTLGNGGVACPARVVLSVANPDGTPRPAPDPRQPSAEERAAWQAKMDEEGWRVPPADHGRCYRAVAPSVARDVTTALEQAVARGTGKRAQIGRPQAGKTGTTDESKQVWFVGYTPDLAVAVSFAALGEQVPLQRIAGCRRQCFGGELPAGLWRDVAAALLADVPPSPFGEAGEDERISPDRRRLGPRARPEPPPVPAPAPSAETAPSPSPSPTASPSPGPVREGESPVPGVTPDPSPPAAPGDQEVLPPVLPSP
jgi:penicillin-binding protein 1A